MKDGFDQEAFWKQFANESSEMCSMILSGHIIEAYHRIGELVKEFSCPFVYEVTCDDSISILIFTPESDPLLAQEIDDFVKVAPRLKGWAIYSRRQRKPVEDVFEILKDVYEVEFANLNFSCVKHGGLFDIVMHSHLAEVLSPSEAIGFIDMFLEHALGEEVSMTRIRNKTYTSSLPSQDCLTAAEFVRLVLNK